MPDSKAWDAAYAEYKKSSHYKANHLDKTKWKSKIQGKSITAGKSARAPKKTKHRNGPVRDVFDKDAWLVTQREYLRWRKTDDFRKWQSKQFLKQGGTCYYCDEPIFGGVRQNVDHVIPKIRRGDNRKANLVLTCTMCNKDKNSTMLPYKERQALKVKNKAKKGTYLKTSSYYQTEADIVDHLRNLT